MFIQERIGRNAIPFYIYKFRTMTGNYKSSITTSEMQISKFGSILRKYKIDELPQLINILQGKMSFVGPRPDTKEMYENLTENEKLFLSIKPGITGLAQIKYRNEEEILSKQINPIEYYKNIIWKDKVFLNNEYTKNGSFKNDLKIILKTLFT